MDLVDPTNPPSRRAPLVWAIGAAIPWLVLVVAQVVWLALDSRLAWAHVAAACVTAVGIAVFVVIVRHRLVRCESLRWTSPSRTGSSRS